MDTRDLLAIMFRSNREVMDASPYANIDFSWGWIEYTRSTYEFLAEVLEYYPAMEKMYEAWIDVTYPDEYSRPYDYELAPEFAKDVMHGTGLYGEGDPMSGYTYNYENILDHDFQYTYFEVGDSNYVILSVHLYGDARGNFSGWNVFKLREHSDGAELFLHNNASIYCDNPECNANWYTDDGSHWYGDSYPDRMPNLESYPIYAGKGRDVNEVMREHCRWQLRLDGVINWDHNERVYGDERGIYVDDNDNAICPCCGKGKLG
jgi:hypothetical protein